MLELTEEFINTAFYARYTLENGSTEEKHELFKKVGSNLFLRDKKSQN